MLEFTASGQMSVSSTVELTVLAEIVEYLSDFCLLQDFGWELVWHLATLGDVSSDRLAVHTEALFDGVPVDDRSVGGEKVHSFVDAGVLEVGGSEKLMDWLQGYLVGVVAEFWWLLGYFEVEYFPFFVCLVDGIASMEFVANEGFSILSSQTFRVALLCLFGIHGANDFFPFGNGITLWILSINEDHNAAFSTHHVDDDIFEVWFVFMFVEQINDFFFEELSLEHIFDGELSSLLDQINHRLLFLWVEDSVGFYYGNCEGKVHLLGIKQSLIHLSYINNP